MKNMNWKPYLSLLRPTHWIKNFFVLIPLVFSTDINLSILAHSAAAFGVFIMASIAGYILNDLLDAKKDRLHPVKKQRPLASGEIDPQIAGAVFVVFLVMTLLAAFTLSARFFLVILAYLLVMMSYSLYLKRLLFLDVLVISLGYCLRVLGGGVATGIAVSDWMVVLVFLFTLFLLLGKRRQEIKNLEKKSKKTRAVLTQYTIPMIDQLHSMIVPVNVMAYLYFIFSQRPDNPYFIFSLPLVMYCFFRYLYLLRDSHFGESLEDFLGDWQLVSVSLVWFFLVLIGLNY